MAMEGTHVRFARDLAAHLKIVNFDAYYSGAVYPDSRYITGIPREETHGEHCPHDPFTAGLTDFEKGWGTHLVYDAMASLEKETALATTTGLWGKQPGCDEMREDGWAFHSAIKLVEDRQSLALLGDDYSIALNLRMIDRPRGEDEATMRRYYGDLRDAYAGTWTFEEYHVTSMKWGMPKERVDRMIELARRFDADPAIFAAIQKLYPTVLERYVLRSVHDARR